MNKLYICVPKVKKIMLSILISEFNYDCSKLAYDLAKQCHEANIAFEVIVLDDASTLYKNENRKISEISGCSFVESELNLGSAETRNKLAGMAKYPHLLMIDCDAEVNDEQYIKHYLDDIDQSQVIIGGVCYSRQKPSSDHILRWYYGKNRECPTAGKRNKHPYKSLLSFNLMIDRDVMLKYPYELFKDYGHEDSVMGFNFKKHGIKVLHIDNPLIHNGLDTNEDFLKKSLKAVEKYLTSAVFQSDELVSQIKIFRIFRIVQKLGLCRLLALKFRIAGNCMKKNLCGKNPSLFLFDVYRLSYLCKLSLSQQETIPTKNSQR